MGSSGEGAELVVTSPQSRLRAAAEPFSEVGSSCQLRFLLGVDACTNGVIRVDFGG